MRRDEKHSQNKQLLQTLTVCYQANLPEFYCEFLAVWFAPESTLNTFDLLRVGGSVAELLPDNLEIAINMPRPLYDEHGRNKKSADYLRRKIEKYMSTDKFGPARAPTKDIDLVTNASEDALKAAFGAGNIKLSPIKFANGDKLYTLFFNFRGTPYSFDIIKRKKLNIEEDQDNRLCLGLYEHVTANHDPKYKDTYTLSLATANNALQPLHAAIIRFFIPATYFSRLIQFNPTGIFYVIKQQLKGIMVPENVRIEVSKKIEENYLKLIENPNIMHRHLQRLFSICKTPSGTYDFVTTWHQLSRYSLTSYMIPYSVFPGNQHSILSELYKLQETLAPHSDFSINQVYAAALLPFLHHQLSTNLNFEINYRSLCSYINEAFISDDLCLRLEEQLYETRAKSILYPVTDTVRKLQSQKLDRATLEKFFTRPARTVSDGFFSYMQKRVAGLLTPLKVDAPVFIPKGLPPTQRCPSADSGFSGSEPSCTPPPAKPSTSPIPPGIFAPRPEQAQQPKPRPPKSWANIATSPGSDKA